MTPKTIEHEARFVVTSVTEGLPCGMTLPTTVQGYLLTNPVSNRLHPKRLEHVHVVKAHLLFVFDTLFELRLGFFEKRFLLLADHTAPDAEQQRGQDTGDDHKYE